MANGITFDTHKFVTGLVAKKMPKEQAEFLAESYNEFFNDRLVTKDYLDARMAQLWAKVIGLHVAVAGTMTAIILTVMRFWLTT